MTTQSSTDNSPNDADVLRLLETFVRKHLGATATVARFSRASTGRSRHNWLFDAVWEHDGKTITEPLIARRDPTGGLLQSDRATEFRVLRALESVAVPTPYARWLDATGEELGRPGLVMGRLEGTCDYYALNGPEPLHERVELAKRLCSLLADVHNVDWRATELATESIDPGPMASLIALDEWEEVLRRDQVEPYPELAYGAQWLRTYAPESPGTSLVHGDFKVGNVLLDEQRNIVGLLDWELAHLGDLHEDLGWITQPLRTREHYITDAWEREELLSFYEGVRGRAVDRDSVHWWNVFATYKTAVMQASGLRAYLEGRSNEHYKPNAPVLTALLRAAIGSALGSPAEEESGPDAKSTGTREAFLRWDTRQTWSLIGGDDVSMDKDPVHANNEARAELVKCIAGLTFDDGDQDLRTKVGRHLLRRVSADPALARRAK